MSMNKARALRFSRLVDKALAIHPEPLPGRDRLSQYATLVADGFKRAIQRLEQQWVTQWQPIEQKWMALLQGGAE